MPSENGPPATPLERANDPDGLSVAQAARELGVHYQSIYNWIRAGRLPVTRFGPTGGIVRIHRQDLARMRNPA